MNVRILTVCMLLYGQAHECHTFHGCDYLADLHGMIMLLVNPSNEYEIPQGCKSQYGDAHLSLIYAFESSGCFISASSCTGESALAVSACLHYSVS